VAMLCFGFLFDQLDCGKPDCEVPPLDQAVLRVT
jgi:hypothetical protein